MQNQDYIVILAWITLKKNYTIKKIISVNNKKKKKNHTVLHHMWSFFSNKSHGAWLGSFKQSNKHIRNSHQYHIYFTFHNYKSLCIFLFFKCLKARVGQCLIVQWSYNK